MRRLPLVSAEDVPEAAGAVGRTVASGGVVLIPTETFYGLAADPASASAVERVCVMKARPKGLPLPILCADWTQVESIVEVPSRHRVRLSRSWPGPLTVVAPARGSTPAGTGGSLAVRIPGHRLLRALLYLVGPLTGTSANRHGAPPSTEVDRSLSQLDPAPDLVLDGGPTPGGIASTLVDLTGPSPKVLRVGAAPWS
jgi:L-threonylcarbamoyladenylate synthase